MLCGCVATDSSLAPTASLAPGTGTAGEITATYQSDDFTMALPDTVAVIPAQRSSEASPVHELEPAEVVTASYADSKAETAPAGPFPPAPAEFVKASPEGEDIFVQPLPNKLSPKTRPFQLPVVAGGSDEVNGLIEKYSTLYDVPVQLVRRVVRRESNFNPSAMNRGHWGLMQIKHATARGMGYRGPPNGLLNAETNLKYAVRYLRGAWLVAEGNPDLADRLYQSGYYYHAKRMGLLDETGLGRDYVRRRAPLLACSMC